MMYHIAVVDDHRLFMDGLVNLIQDDAELKLAFTANNATTMREKMQEHRVDLLLLDVNLPPDNGLVLMAEVQKQYPATKVMILSMYMPADIRLSMQQFTGDAYVLKTSGQDILEKAIDNMKRGVRYLDPSIGPQQEPNTPDAFTAQLKLTRREKEIISMVAAGKSNKEIAAELFLSELTIQTHRRNISEKIGAKGASDFIHKSLQLQQKL